MMCMNFVNNTVSLKIMSTLNIGLINSLTGIPSYFCSGLPSNYSFRCWKMDEEREIIRSKPEERARGEGRGTWHRHTLNMCISTQHCNRAWQKQIDVMDPLFSPLSCILISFLFYYRVSYLVTNHQTPTRPLCSDLFSIIQQTRMILQRHVGLPWTRMISFWTCMINCGHIVSFWHVLSWLGIVDEFLGWCGGPWWSGVHVASF